MLCCVVLCVKTVDSPPASPAAVQTDSMHQRTETQDTPRESASNAKNKTSTQHLAKTKSGSLKNMARQSVNKLKSFKKYKKDWKGSNKVITFFF